MTAFFSNITASAGGINWSYVYSHVPGAWFLQVLIIWVSQTVSCDILVLHLDFLSALYNNILSSDIQSIKLQYSTKLTVTKTNLYHEKKSTISYRSLPIVGPSIHLNGSPKIYWVSVVIAWHCIRPGQIMGIEKNCFLRLVRTRWTKS